MALDCCAVEEIRPRTRQQRDRVVAGEGAEIRAIEMALFDELEQGDLLFFDGSHRVFQNSDVTVFFLEVLPRLKPGVLVHIHDIFLPDDYPANWTSRLFSEQYMLGAMVLCQTAPFRIILPNYYVSGHDELSQDVRELFRARGGEIMPAAYFRGAKTVVGSSF